MVESMEFATRDLQERLLKELRQAARADIGVAYFGPDEKVLAALQKVPCLRLLVANDFQANNPHPLEVLSKNHWVRAVVPEVHGGNLHSKVYLIRRKNKSFWAMVGSANLTRPGLTTNQEACIILDSAKGDDLSDVRRWIGELFGQEYEEIDFELAGAVFETRNRRTSKEATKKSLTTGATQFWALKAGYCGEYWQNFLAEDVVGMGWGQMKDPSDMTREQAKEAYRAVWTDDGVGAVNGNVAQIIRFTQTMNSGDLVLICGRYDSAGTEKDAYIYGIARTNTVNGQCYFYDAESDWYRLKRHATIQRVEQYLPRRLVARALGVWAIVPTILDLDQAGFTRLEKLLRTELGVVLDI
jgi:HKD family nuclease